MKLAILITLISSRALAFVVKPSFSKDRSMTSIFAKPEEAKDDKTTKSDVTPGSGLDLDLNEMFDM